MVKGLQGDLIHAKSQQAREDQSDQDGRNHWHPKGVEQKHHVGAEGENRAMGEVNQAQNTKHQGVAYCDQRVRHAKANTL